MIIKIDAYKLNDDEGIGSSGLWFVYLFYLNTKTHRYNYWSIKNTIQTLVAEEVYNTLVFIFTNPSVRAG